MSKRCSAEELEEYFGSKGADHITKMFKYDRRGAKEVIARMQSPTGIVVEGHLLRVFREQGFELDPERDNKSEYDPRAVFDALERYKPADVRYDDAVLRQAIALCYRAFGLPEGMEKLKMITFDHELHSAVRLDKSSGAPAFSNKGSAFESDLRRSRRIVEGTTTPPPCVAYHRVQHGAEGPKTRLVWGYPLSMTLVEARFARPLIDRFLQMRTPMAFGLVKHQLGGRVLETSGKGVTYALDFSKYDATIPTRILRTAFEILATHFDFSEEGKVAWSRVINYFQHTPILMPDGNVYQKHVGVPSGSYFTQMIDSLANYIVIQYMALLVAKEPISDRRLNVLGDDSLFSLADWVDIERFAQIAASLGMTVNVLKSGRYRDGEAPSFLGHEWHAGIPDRPRSEIVKRIVFPEMPWQRDRSSADFRARVEERLMAYVGDAACAWSVALYSGQLGWSNDLSAYQLLHRRSSNPITGMEEVQSLLGDGVPSAAKTMLLGLIR